MAKDVVAILGGTGDQGLGLAYRLAAAGHRVRIGSRVQERALAAQQEVLERVPAGNVVGLLNADAARAAAGGIVVLSVPFEHSVSTLKGVKGELREGTILVSMAVPLATVVGDVAGRTIGVSQGSCAELIASLAPPGVPVISAFQNVPAHRLMALGEPVECDVIVSGPREPRKKIMELCSDIPGLRGIDGGPLHNARAVENWTALLIGINTRYKVPEGTGVRITYI